LHPVKIKKDLLGSFVIFCIVEITHSFFNTLGIYSEGSVDFVLHVLSLFFLFVFSIIFLAFLFKNYIFFKELKLQKLNYSRLSLTIGVYYFMFVGVYSGLLCLTEGNIRGSGWFVSLPVIGVIFSNYGFVLCIIANFLLPLGIISGIIGFLKNNNFESRKIALISFIINVTMFLLIPRLRDFIYD